MDLLTLFTLAVGLSMDAFAVAVCKGLAMRKLTMKNAVIVGAWFGGFQALMPAIGYVLGVQFKDKITAIDHWIAFILLGLIGFNMIKRLLVKKRKRRMIHWHSRRCSYWQLLPVLMHWRLELRLHFVGKYRSGSVLYRCDYLLAFDTWCQGWKCIWYEV